MADPITLAIAAAIAGKGAESLGKQAGPALTSLVRRVKEKFAGKPAETAALEAARAHPEDERHTEALAAALDRAGADDPAFHAELRSLWQQTTASGDAVINNFYGNTEKTVQLRDVHGDMHF